MLSKLFVRNTLAVFCASTLVACGSSSDGGNTAPSLASSSLSFTLDEDSSVSGALSASDADGDILGYSVSQSPEFGSIDLQQDGSFVYTPNADFFGEDSAILSVSDSIESTSATVSFSVTNVNDLPIINTTSVAVSSAGETQGVIEASDVDGDALTYAIVTQPSSGTVTLNTQTGAFVYEQSALENTDDVVVISVTDNIGEPVKASISLSPSYVTNDDKVAYYYASTHSHLAQAESIITLDNAEDTIAINDAEITADVYATLSEGYAQAGFADIAERFITDSIIDRTTRASAYRLSAAKLDEQGRTEEANTFRSRAIAEYNAYIAEIGVTNFSQSDADFYRDIVRDYLDAGASEEVDEILALISIYADANSDLDEEITSTFRRFPLAMIEYASELVELYLGAPTEAGFDNAYNALTFLDNLNEKTSFNETSGNNYYTNKTYFQVEATRLAFLLSLQGSDENIARAETLSRSFLAKVISNYTDVTYDDDYAQVADEYAEQTTTRYPTGIGLMSGVFAALYPEYIIANSDNGFLGNLPLELVYQEEGATDSDTKRAYRDHYAYQLLVDAKNGQDLAATVASIETLFTTTYDDTELAVEALVEQDNVGAIDQRGAWLLNYAGYTEQAQFVVQEAVRIMGTDAYLQDIQYNYDKLLDNDGCLRYSQLYQTFGGDESGASAIINTCVNYLTTYYSDDTYYSDANRVSALLTGASIYDLLGDDAAAETAIDTALVLALSLDGTDEDSFDDFESSIEHQIETMNTYASLGYLSKADSAFAVMADSTLVAMESVTDIEERVELLDTILGELENAFEPGSENSFTGTYQLLEAVKRNAGQNDDYASVYASIMSKAISLQNSLLDYTADFADNENIDMYETFIEQYSWLGEYDSANNLVQSDIYTDANRDELYAIVAEALAEKDDFPATTVANVDTDNDGLANFFLPSASEEAVLGSGISADNDADNDGIDDQEDLSPLDAD